MDIKQQIKNDYREEAPAFEVDYSHDIPAEAIPLYVADIREILAGSKSQHALDVGCGTGFHTNALLQCGYTVRGVDFVPEMLTVAQEAYPNVNFGLVDDIENAADFYSPDTFDLISCKHVACHFVDPIQTFQNWWGWLKPGGRVAVVEALWFRDHWQGSYKSYPDQLPLSCTQTWATISYMLEKAGFEVSAYWMHRINGYEAVRTVSTGSRPLVRYMVVGKKVSMGRSNSSPTT